MTRTLIKNAQIVNEGKILEGDVLIEGNRISKIESQIQEPKPATTILDIKGQLLLPGMIDDQVHFREPGLTHKADIASESRAAIAGGITSFIEMPNTQPQTTSLKALGQKFELAKQHSHANYSFMLGGTNSNLEEILRLPANECAGIKLFLGSSTGNMLVDNPNVLEKIFKNTNRVISVHCEDEQTIKENHAYYFNKYGNDIPMKFHPKIRSEQACFLSSSKAIELAKKTGARLHVFHLSTEKETHLFDGNIPLKEKKITAEVCIHHLWFSDFDYASKGTHIKWNPAVKTTEDRAGLWEALRKGQIDVIATDHAPHTLAEKNNPYTSAPSGGPLVQHAMVALLEKVKEGYMSLTEMVQKTAHNPAILFEIKDRGYIKEGYFADLVVADISSKWTVSTKNILYKCGWSPFDGIEFSSQIKKTFVNGQMVYDNGILNPMKAGSKLTFNREE